MKCFNKPSGFLAIVILVLALWPEMVGVVVSMRIIAVCSVLILISSCRMSCQVLSEVKKSKSRKKR